MSDRSQTVLIIGATRGLGLGLAREFADRGWRVIGTARGTDPTPLHELAEASDGRVGVEQADVNDPDGLQRLRERLDGVTLDLLFVNAGITDPDVPAEQVDPELFAEVMLTNALGPLRVIDALSPLVTETGTIAVMSSRQGSIGLNTRGGHEVYRASKSALNQLMRSYAARGTDRRTFLLIHPGWIRTELGGSGAQLTVEDSVPGIVDTLLRHTGDGGLQFRDFHDEIVPC